MLHDGRGNILLNCLLDSFVVFMTRVYCESHADLSAIFVAILVAGWLFSCLFLELHTALVQVRWLY